MSTSLMGAPVAADVEKVLIGGDLAKLTPDQRLSYYNAVCRSLGLNPLTKPFAYLTLNSKMVLYALKDCTEQLRNIHAISLQIPAREVLEGVYVVTARATRPDGRQDESTGAVSVEGLKGDNKANAMMKAETKAKRRVTLSICGLGMLDETEVEAIPDAVKVEDVAQRRIAEERIAEETEKARPSFEMLKAFKGIKADLKKITSADKRYYDVLGAHGYEHSNEIPTRDKGEAVYRELKGAFVEEMERVENAK